MNSRALSESLQMQMPLVLAPMAGGPGTPELAAAVSEAGGLGSVGAAYLSPQKMEDLVLKLRALTKKPFSINLFCPHPIEDVSPARKSRALDFLREDRQKMNLPEPVIAPPYEEDFKAQFEMVLKLKPAVFSFVFGLMPSWVIDRCRKEGIQSWGTATTLAEAQALESSGVDAIVLQGYEAGGHRALFDANSEDPAIALDELLKSCVGKISRPLIAAGGLMNGKDIARVLGQGATAAQMGTAFLLCPEAGTSEPYRRELQKGRSVRTKTTRAFSGRWARGIENGFMRKMDGAPEEILPFPIQNQFTRDLRKADADRGGSESLSLWAGTEFYRARPASASVLMERFKEEMFEATK